VSGNQDLSALTSYLPEDIRYIATDAFYSKFKWVNGIVGLGLHAIGKLRADANLKVLYTGPQKPKGRRRKYDAKLDCSELSEMQRKAGQFEGWIVYRPKKNPVPEHKVEYRTLMN